MAQYKSFSSIGKNDNDPDPNTMGDVVKITSSRHRTSIINTTQIVVIDNYANWCGPCKMCAPNFAVLAGKYNEPGKCVLVKEDVDDEFEPSPPPAVRSDIRGVPCFHFYLRGQFLEDATVVGADMNVIEETIKNLLSIINK